MAELGKAYVQIVPSARGMSGSITNALRPEASSAGTSAGTSIAQSIGKSLQSAGKTMMKTGAFATALAVPIVAGIKNVLSAYETQLAAESKLEEVMKTRTGATEAQVNALKLLASEQQKLGIIGDEVALSGAQQLATFVKTPDAVNNLIPAMNNLLAQQKGYNATAEDAVGIGNLMGKVLQGQTGALKRVGITFSEEQEKMLKYGTEEERVAVLSQVITDNVGNMNAKLADTPLGKITQMKNAFGDLKEQLGASLAPVLSEIAQKISEEVLPKIEAFISFMQEHPIIAKVVVGLTALLAVGGPLLIFIGSIVSAVGAIIPVIGAVTAAVGALNIAALPITGTFLLIVAAIAAVIAIGVLLYKHWDEVKNFAAAAWDTIKTTISTVVEAIKIIINLWIEAVKNYFIGMKNAITTIVQAIFQGVKDRFQLMKDIVSGIFKAFVALLKGDFSGAKNILLDLASGILSGMLAKFQAIKDGITNKLNGAKDKIKTIIGAIKGFFNFKISWPHIPMPHFSISPSGWSVGDLLQGSIPRLSINWYAKGGIFKKPTVLSGLGEAGAEAALPLDPFWDRLDNWGSSIIDGIALVAAGMQTEGDITVQTYLYPNGPKMDEYTYKAYNRGKARLG